MLLQGRVINRSNSQASCGDVRSRDGHAIGQANEDDAVGEAANWQSTDRRVRHARDEGTGKRELFQKLEGL